MRQKKKTRETLIEALMESDSVTTAAEKVGMSRQHVHKLLHDPDFQRVLRQARSQAHGHAMSRLCHLSSRAVSALESALDGVDVSKTKYLAAAKILELAGQAVTADIEDRLEEIEAQLARMEVVE